MQSSQQLGARLTALYAAMSSGNADAVEAFYSLEAGSSFIGTDAAEFWLDSARHNADVRRFFDGSHGTNNWQSGPEPLAVIEGTVGWTVDRPSLALGDGSRYDALRVTLVWHLEDGQWKVVQSHASVGQAG